MSEPEILFEARGAVGLITLNRPKALNALTRAMCIEMKSQLDAWKSDAGIRCVVIQAAGERAFCAGGDIRSLYESGMAGLPSTLEFYRDEYILNAAIKHYPKPFIAFIRGIVMGGGVGVSVHGGYRVASEGAVFAMPETGIGLFPDVGGSYFLPRCPGQIGMYLALTGNRLKTADCLYSGIATHAVPAAQLDTLLARLAQGEDPAKAIASLSQDAGDAPLSHRRAAIDRLFGGSSVEAILTALDAEEGEWARETAATIRAKSPTATKLAFRQLREGKRLDFDDCMRMEYRMVSRVITGHEFYEGIRATIIDKDQRPVWRPASLDEVTDGEIEAYFAPLGDKELRL